MQCAHALAALFNRYRDEAQSSSPGLADPLQFLRQCFFPIKQSLERGSLESKSGGLLFLMQAINLLDSEIANHAPLFLRPVMHVRL